MDQQKNDVRPLTEEELSSVAGGMFMDASVQIMGKTLHVWASSDVGISGAYWTRVWDGNGWRYAGWAWKASCPSGCAPATDQADRLIG